MYGRRWNKARKAYLSEHQFCTYCYLAGSMTRATVVDHIQPHRGDGLLFWNESNWQALCETCHNAAKQSQEKTGRVRGCDKAGKPLDPNHHWSN